jgi:4-hydroxy-L-threonine phosphate dehydrogenase PdxA
MTGDSARPNIAVTIGDPAGIGPEVLLKALSAPDLQGLASWVVVGDRVALEKTAEACAIAPVPPNATVHDPGMFQNPGQFNFGELNANCGRAAVEYVKHATQMCLAGNAQAMVTAPLNKEAVTLSGLRFSGHTEYIAELCGVTESRMLLASPKLSVVHVTTHVALRDALNASSDRILRTMELGNEAMKRLGFRHPRIAMCGLNPHAGEHGLFGKEDRAARGAYDLVVAMYHDQGHIAMKLIDFERTVNVTLGIPIIRTSVDHGTGFDIAGKNQADPQNMIAALKMAVAMAAPAHGQDTI